MLHGTVSDQILPQASLMFSGPLWSISLEWQFYLVAPLLVFSVLGSLARQVVVGAALMVAFIALKSVTAEWWQGEVPSFLPLRLPMFLVGILCAVAWDAARKTRPSVVAAGCLAAALACTLIAPKAPALIWFATYFVAATSHSFAPSKLLSAVVAHAIPRFVGRISYGLYVIHMPILLCVAYFLVIPNVDSRIVAAALLTVIALPLALLVAYTSYERIEKPVIRWARYAGFRGAVQMTRR